MKSLFLFLLIVLNFSLFGQLTDFEKNQIIEKRIEYMQEVAEDSDFDYTTYMEDLYNYLENPINLNQTSFNQLISIHILSDIECSAIISYINNYKKIHSIYELQAIEMLDKDKVKLILPFVYVGPIKNESLKLSNFITDGHSDVFLRYQRVLETKKGYESDLDSSNNLYTGDPNKYYLRYKYAFRDKISYGITAEKDPGETFFNAPNNSGFDFYSAHLSIRNSGIIKNVIIGDFHANFGQGLTMWTGFNMGKSAQVLNIKQGRTGIRPYTSVNESNFLRGVGFTLGFKNIETTAYFSKKNRDASLLNQDSLYSDNEIVSFQITGLHRTVNEIAKKNVSNQLVVGGASSITFDRLKINTTYVYKAFDNSISSNTQIYNQYAFSGEQQFSLGVDYQYIYRKLSIFGEASSSGEKSLSLINGVLWHIDQQLELVALFRHFNIENNGLFQSNFSRTNSNETGLYIGLNSKINKHINVQAYYDQYRSKWFKYLIDGPSIGRSIFFQINYKMNRYASLYFRFKNSLREKNSNESLSDIQGQVIQESNSYRIQYNHKINRNISIKSRVEWKRYKLENTTSKGLVLYQDLIYRFNNIPLKLYGRYALFDTDDYNSRIYSYENDLLYVFSVPAYYYKGTRTYLMMKYDIGKKIDLWIKYSQFIFNDLDEISSGLETINGNKKSEIKVQLRIKL